MICFDQVGLGYQQNRVLLGPLSFQISSGEILFLAGANGSGKTLLLKSLSDQIMPLMGEKSNSFRPSSTYCFFDRPACLNEFSVREFLLWPGFLTKKTNRFEEVIHFWELEYLLDRSFSSLSMGQKQLVSLSQMQMSNKDLFLLDEPFNFLDMLAQKKVMVKLLDWLKREEKTCILSLHQWSLVAQFSQRLFFLREGELLDTTYTKLVEEKEKYFPPDSWGEYMFVFDAQKGEYTASNKLNFRKC